MTYPHTLGLYVHIPFCARLCSYCDFAKTARWDSATVKAYFAALNRDWQFWQTRLTTHDPQFRITSLSFGGGTPGLFADQIVEFSQKLSSRLAPDAELGLELNPHNLNVEDPAWQYLITRGWRLSFGVQTFSPQGLQLLGRDHTPEVSERALATARRLDARFSLDLIFGWPGQTLEDWKHDLERAISLEPQHISCYNLTYEGPTPLARRHRRGQLTPASESLEAEMYELAQRHFAAQGWEHYEVSNWARSANWRSRHNSQYWTLRPYLGLGAGSHSFLRWDTTGIGSRYQTTRHLASYLAAPPGGVTIPDLDRTRHGAALELLATGLRSTYGVDCAQLRRWGLCIDSSALDAFAPAQDALTKDGDTLRLHPREWFREQAWTRWLSTLLRKETTSQVFDKNAVTSEEVSKR